MCLFSKKSSKQPFKKQVLIITKNPTCLNIEAVHEGVLNCPRYSTVNICQANVRKHPIEKSPKKEKLQIIII